MYGRKVFLEKQINIFHDIIGDLEESRINGKQKRDLENLKVLYKQYVGEYTQLLIKQRDNR